MNDDKEESLNACKKYLRFFFKNWITGYKESFISNLTFMKKSIYKYGWEYSIDDKQILAIIPKPDSQKPIPKSLFKYY